MTPAGCRRSFVDHLLHKITTLSISAFAVLITQVVYTKSVNADQASRPNIVLIMADDMGYSDLGCFGGEIRTPNLDRLAAGGLRFTNFYSENMCWVSRAALLTGVYHKTSLLNGALHPRCVTLAEALRGNGYQTRMSGKWHLAGKPYHIYPMDRGFDEFYGIPGGAASFFAPHRLSRNRKNVEQEARDDPDYYFTDAVSTEAERMILSADAEKPLFLYTAYTAAHWPLHAPEADVKAYQGAYKMGWDQLREQRLARMKKLGILPDALSLSPRHPNAPAWKDEPHKAWQQRRMEVYAAQVTAMDRGIGRILDALRKTNRFNNTLIFFMIDNGGCHVEYGANRKGDYLPEKTRDGRPVRPGNLPEIMPGPEDTYQSYGHGWANASNTPYRLFKQYDHEGGIRTPMIAHWPDGIATASKGKLVPAVSHLTDVMPTVLQATGAKTLPTDDDKPRIPADGRSLVPTFSGKEHLGRETLFFHHAKGRALRHGEWKIVAENKRPWELYHLKQDPLELRDLAQEKPEKVKELAALWQSESTRLAKQAKRR
ncbi:MAG: arylsulfatase [Planctomycetales bacterium]